MQNNILYLVTKNFDKNHSIQLQSSNDLIIYDLHTIFCRICGANDPSASNIFNQNKYKKFVDLNLFLQGRDKNWIMLEAWSDKDDLIIEFAEFCAKELNLKLDII